MPAEGYFAPLPSGMTDSPPYTRLRDDFVEHVYRSSHLTLWEHKELGMEADVGETERDFKERCQEEARRRRDEELATLQARQARDLERLQARLEKAQQNLDDKEVQHQGRKQEEVLSAGESLLSLVLGRKRTTLLSQASRRRRLTAQARLDVEQLEAEVKRLEDEVQEAQTEQQAALQAVRDKWSDVAMEVAQMAVRPRKSDIRVDLFGLVWLPQWRLGYRGSRGPGEAVTAAGPLS